MQIEETILDQRFLKVTVNHGRSGVCGVWLSAACETCESDLSLAPPHRAARATFATLDFLSSLTTPLQIHRPRSFPTFSRPQIESKSSRDGVQPRRARYARAACRRGSTTTRKQEVKEGRRHQKNTYVLSTCTRAIEHRALRLTFCGRGCCARSRGAVWRATTTSCSIRGEEGIPRKEAEHRACEEMV